MEIRVSVGKTERKSVLHNHISYLAASAYHRGKEKYAKCGTDPFPQQLWSLVLPIDFAQILLACANRDERGVALRAIISMLILKQVPCEPSRLVALYEYIHPLRNLSSRL